MIIPKNNQVWCDNPRNSSFRRTILVQRDNLADPGSSDWFLFISAESTCIANFALAVFLPQSLVLALRRGMISPREASDPSVPETATAVGRTSVLNYRTFSVNFGDFVSSSLQTSCKKCKGQVFRPSVGTVCVHWELAAKLVAEKVSYPTVYDFRSTTSESSCWSIRSTPCTHWLVVFQNRPTAGFFDDVSVVVSLPRIFHFIRMSSR